MRYSAVTLGDEDVEWLDTEYEDLKPALFDDDLFRAHTESLGLTDALEIVTKFHRVIANQLIERAVVDYRQSDWTRRAINMCKRAKIRRNELRRYYGVQNGVPALIAIKREFDVKYPRAEWGSAA
jgi:hypothetical protein